MKFLITRTSRDYGDESSPCKKYPSSSEEYTYPDGEVGLLWYVEVKDLSDLHKLQDEEGNYPLIIHDNVIEIYDDYRE